jgi:hypothetical protein
MKFILLILALSSYSAFAQDFERCFFSQIDNTANLSKKICNQHVNEFSVRSNATCKVVRYDMNSCWSECVDEEKKKLAKVRIDMTSDCEREQVDYGRTIIKYYR